MKKAKKFLLNLLAFASVSAFAFGMVACGGDKNSNVDAHIHTYNQQITTNMYLKNKGDCTNKSEYYYSCECGARGDLTFTGGDYVHTFNCEVVDGEYLKSAANCKSLAVYYKSCECGERGTATFEYGEIGKHIPVAGICSVCSLNVESKGLEYEISDDGTYYIVTGIGECKDSVLYIPATYDDLPVMSIGEYAFAENQTLTGITIPNSITTISDYAFAWNENLTSVTIPHSVTTIGELAFCLCGLKSITIPDSVTSIGVLAFGGCENLESIVVDEGNLVYQSIDGNLYTKDEMTLLSYAPGQKTVTFNIPDGVTEIGDCAFLLCENLQNIIIPDSVTLINSQAFEECYGLTNIIIPNSVTSIGHSAFSGCINLTSVILSENITSIGASTFNNCINLTNITIPEGVVSIGHLAFYDCKKLLNITIPESLQYLDDMAFAYCYHLVEVYNKSSLNITAGDNQNGNVAEYALSVYTEPYTSKVSVDDNGYIVYTDRDDKVLVGYTGEETDLTLPSDITKIHSGAFYNSEFYGSNVLTSITIPDSVTAIGENAFFGCYNLTSITIPDSVISIGNGAFWNCYKLVEVYNKSSLNITAGDNQNGSVAKYALSVYTEPYTSKVSVDDNGYIIYTDRDDKVLVGYTGEETDLMLPVGITQIKSYAFYNCDSLTSITIPDSVTTIGDQAFRFCDNLTCVTIGNSVTAIGERAFDNCDSLMHVMIPNSVTTIGDEAFQSCDGLINVRMGNSVTMIGWGAFLFCENLESVVFEDTSTWYKTHSYEDWQNKVNGTQVDVSDSVNSASLLNDWYYWYKL